MIQLKADAGTVEAAAKAVEEHANAKGNEAFRKEIGRIANTIIDAGKLDNYGTPKAQEYLKKWATESLMGKRPPVMSTGPARPWRLRRSMPSDPVSLPFDQNVHDA